MENVNLSVKKGNEYLRCRASSLDDVFNALNLSDTQIAFGNKFKVKNCETGTKFRHGIVTDNSGKWHAMEAALYATQEYEFGITTKTYETKEEAIEAMRCIDVFDLDEV